MSKIELVEDGGKRTRTTVYSMSFPHPTDGEQAKTYESRGELNEAIRALLSLGIKPTSIGRETDSWESVSLILKE